MSRISICELAEWQAAGRTFSLLDVRRTSVRLADATEIPGAHWRDPEEVFTWKDQEKAAAAQDKIRAQARAIREAAAAAAAADEKNDLLKN